MAANQAPPVDLPPDITYLGFNQDQTCLAVGTQCGFRIFGTDSFTMLHREDCGAVVLIEMLFRTSLLALVGSSSARGTPSSSSSSSKELTMWNTKERCNICQLHFSADIHAVKMNHRRIVVLLKTRIHIFDLRTTKSLHIIDRVASPWVDPSLSWLCAASEHGHLAAPVAMSGAPTVSSAGPLATITCGGQEAAGVPQGADPQEALPTREEPPRHLGQGDECIDEKLGFVTVVDTYTLNSVGTFLAHRSPIRALCVNPTGQLLATASVKGTVVRLFRLPVLDMVYSFRRGASSCQIFGLLFSRDSAHVCASAGSGTVHIFRNSEELLESLPLESEEATLGAAQREMISKAAAPGGAEGSAATSADAACEGLAESQVGARDAEADAEDLVDWHVIAERPDRALEQSVGAAPNSSPGPGAGALQVLAAVSGYAVNATKYAKSLRQLLPEVLDAPRAFAWVHLREDGNGGCAEPQQPDSLQLAMAGMGWLSDIPGTRGKYVACINLKPRNSASEVLVATMRGCALVYGWSPAVGGECRLRSEHSFMSQWFQHS
uniref:Autophagy-related protein 18 n=1 Tax=Alexandrium monilatum TaxID=311494 RepID=A0A7S4TAX7_9DINO|mmetsp:Transcript_106312/g.317721  ORF Transcript_106312/g.317721 Transcript_106312/m.317721 type:complete len:550 (+) Transcript_106312:40-1689(+)